MKCQIVVGALVPVSFVIVDELIASTREYPLYATFQLWSCYPEDFIALYEGVLERADASVL